MTSWVLAIDKQYPEHWDIAKAHRFWDLRTPKRIESGDVVYFWRSGESFAARVVVTADARDLGPGEALPWRDAASTAYRQRFPFTDPREPIASPKWGEVARAAGLRVGPNWTPHSDDPEVEAALRVYFEGPVGSRDAVDLAFAGEADALIVLTEDLTEDRRERVYAEIALRRGQGQFRQGLLAAYGQCAVTGTTTESVLEAAHISPYRGEHTNQVVNGLLLRADIHTLFDLYLLTVVPSDGRYFVRVAPSVTDPHYQVLDGQPLTLPIHRHERPDPSVLLQHNEQCEWLTAVQAATNN